MTKLATIWQPLVRHRSVLIGALLIGAVWTTLSLFLSNERNSAERAAIQNSTNLAGALASHLSNSLGEVDRSLTVIAALYAQSPENFDLLGSLKANRSLSDAISRVSIVDRNGTVLHSSDASLRGRSVKDRGFFKVQAEATTNEFFVGKPILSETTAGKWTLELSRRIIPPDGRFEGVVAASLDSGYLTRIYNSVNIGEKGYIRVIGLDGIVRATSGDTMYVLGKDFSRADLFTSLSSTRAGWYYTGSGLSDSIPRLIAYRVASDYPFVVTVGVAVPEMFAHVAEKRKSGRIFATLLTLLIACASTLSIRGQMQREAARKRLERANMFLNATLANMPHGICMFGADARLVLANELYSTMYGLAPDAIKPGMTLSEILQLRVAAGSCPADAEKYVSDRIKEAFDPEPGYIINKLQDGRTLAVSRRAMPDGGTVAVHQDITAHLHTEQQLDQTRQFLDSIIENIPVAVVVKDAVTRKFVLVNRAFETMLKVGRNEVLGKTVFEIYRRQDAERMDA